MTTDNEKQKDMPGAQPIAAHKIDLGVDGAELRSIATDPAGAPRLTRTILAILPESVSNFVTGVCKNPGRIPDGEINITALLYAAPKGWDGDDD